MAKNKVTGKGSIKCIKGVEEPRIWYQDEDGSGQCVVTDERAEKNNVRI